MKQARTIIIPLFFILGSSYIQSDPFGSEGANQAPTAEAMQNVTATINETVVFFGNYSDEDGSVVLMEWDFDGDENFDWQRDLTINWPDDVDSMPGYRAEWSYNETGKYIAILKVTDNDGVVGTDACTITVS